MGSFLSSLFASFYSRKIDIVLVGLENRSVGPSCQEWTAAGRIDD